MSRWGLVPRLATGPSCPLSAWSRTSQPVLPHSTICSAQASSVGCRLPTTVWPHLSPFTCVSVSRVCLFDSSSLSLFIPVICFSFLSVTVSPSTLAAFSPICLLSCDPFHPLALCFASTCFSFPSCLSGSPLQGPPRLRLASIARASPIPLRAGPSHTLESGRGQRGRPRASSRILSHTPCEDFPGQRPRTGATGIAGQRLDQHCLAVGPEDPVVWGWHGPCPAVPDSSQPQALQCPRTFFSPPSS